MDECNLLAVCHPARHNLTDLVRRILNPFDSFPSFPYLVDYLVSLPILTFSTTLPSRGLSSPRKPRCSSSVEGRAPLPSGALNNQGSHPASYRLHRRLRQRPANHHTRQVVIIGGSAAYAHAAVCLREDYGKSIALIEKQDILACTWLPAQRKSPEKNFNLGESIFFFLSIRSRVVTAIPSQAQT